MGPGGLEPPPPWLKARHAAANTLIPPPPAAESPVWRAVRRPPLRDGAGRNRTLAWQIKSLLCCPYTTTPLLWGRRLRRQRACMIVLSIIRSGWSRTTACALSGRSAAVTPPSAVRQPSARVAPHRLEWVGRRSNPRPLVFSQVLNRLSYRPPTPVLSGRRIVWKVIFLPAIGAA